MSVQKLERTTFETSRAAEYFSTDELAKQTGQETECFGDVVVEELADNALEAAEAAGVAPHVEIGCRHRGSSLVELSVADNGLGILPKAVESILDFTTRTLDKSHYRSPTRGAQGNALKGPVVHKIPPPNKSQPGEQPEVREGQDAGWLFASFCTQRDHGETRWRTDPKR